MKRVLIHILRGYVLELIATEIFYEFLNKDKIFKDFTRAKYCQISKAKKHIRYMISNRKRHSMLKSNLQSFQNMLSKLWATYEMNFSERKIHGAFKCNLTFLTLQIRGSARDKSILQQMFQPKYIQFKQSQVPQ